MKNILSISMILLAFSLVAQPGNEGEKPQNKTDEKGRKQGLWMKRHPSNTVPQYYGRFKDDKPQGRFYFYYPSGKTKAVVDYENNAKLARSVMFHETGEVMGKGKYVNEKKDSVWTYYDRKGLISMRETYDKGKLHGKKIVYYTPKRNGEERIAEITHFKNGIAHGEWKQFFQNGTVKAEGVYVDGNYDGTFTYYHANGNKSSVKRYKNAVLHGWQRVFDENGKKLDEKLYIHNKELKGKEKEEYIEKHRQKQLEKSGN